MLTSVGGKVILLDCAFVRCSRADIKLFHGQGQDLVRDPQTPAQSFVTTFIRTSLPSKKRNQLQEATESSSFESECSKKPLAGCGVSALVAFSAGRVIQEKDFPVLFLFAFLCVRCRR